MEYLIIGLAVAFNILIILWKFQHKDADGNSDRVLDAILDMSLLGIVTIVFSGSYGALVVGTVASAVVSLYLLVNKPQMPSFRSRYTPDPSAASSFLDTFINRARRKL